MYKGKGINENNQTRKFSNKGTKIMAKATHRRNVTSISAISLTIKDCFLLPKDR